MSMSLLQVFQQFYDMLREPRMECAHPHAHEIADVYRMILNYIIVRLKSGLVHMEFIDEFHLCYVNGFYHFNVTGDSF